MHVTGISSRAAVAARSGVAGGRRRVAAARAAVEIRDPRFADKRQFQVNLREKSADELKRARPENVEGDFYVDNSCIDCQTCRWVAPETFTAVGMQAAVTRQPASQEERVRALQALVSCPVYAIHARERAPADLKAAQQALPRPWPTAAPGVYHTGWHAQGSYGGAGWLMVRGGGRGNVLVDSPRFNPVLAKQIEALGGVEYIFLTHKDDVADHEKWAKHFGARRIIHEGEATARQGTDQCEVIIKGQGPWPFPDGDGDLTIVHTPGHTEDHCVLISDKHKALFSGDHLSGAEDVDTHWKMDGRLFVFTEFNWYSVDEQLKSVQKLLDYDWLHVLPGHGAPARLRDAAERLKSVAEMVAREGAKERPVRVW